MKLKKNRKPFKLKLYGNLLTKKYDVLNYNSDNNTMVLIEDEKLEGFNVVLYEDMLWYWKVFIICRRFIKYGFVGLKYKVFRFFKYQIIYLKYRMFKFIKSIL